MHRDVMTFDVLQDAAVGRGLPALVMLRLQAVDRDDNLQPLEMRPLERDRSDRAGHQLRVDAHRGHPRQNVIQLPITDERLSSDNRHMEWSVLLDQGEHRRDELFALEITKLAERDVASQVIAPIRVATWAGERTLPG